MGFELREWGVGFGVWGWGFGVWARVEVLSHTLIRVQERVEVLPVRGSLFARYRLVLLSASGFGVEFFGESKVGPSADW